MLCKILQKTDDYLHKVKRESEKILFFLLDIKHKCYYI